MSMRRRAPPGVANNNILTGKQEHYLKRELISQEVQYEISELSSPTALRRFGAPFRSDLGEVSPMDSDLPILRFIFVHHVRNFPFLDKAKEKEFWQDKVQVFLESFANKQISSSEDRLEETKRRKLAMKFEKLVELMMNSGIPTASGYEERVGFDEIEVVERGANDESLMVNVPEGHFINGWDVNVIGVRQTSVKRTVRYHSHAGEQEFLIRVKSQGSKEDVVVGRRYGSFSKLNRDLRREIPGKMFPPIPRKNKSTTNATGLFGYTKDDSDNSSVSSVSTVASSSGDTRRQSLSARIMGHGRSSSRSSSMGRSVAESEKASPPASPARVHIWREDQRVSLRAYLRNLLKNPQVASSKSIKRFLTEDSITLNREEIADEDRRKQLDRIRVEEQIQFYEITRQKARELDVYMEQFRRECVEDHGLSKLMAEIKSKNHISELSQSYQKFAEWLRIEIAATVYHIFLAEDNSPELFAQMKRIHSLIPYTVLKNIIRIANPAAVMSGVLDLFLAQPFRSRSLMQRVLGMAIADGIRNSQRTIDALIPKINEPIFCEKIKLFAEAPDGIRDAIRADAVADDVDILVSILRSDMLAPDLEPEQVGQVFNAFVAWNNAVDNVDDEMRAGAVLFAQMKQLLKLYTRRRDKQMMAAMIEENVTLQLFRDLFQIFYEPLVRVYKSANVYNSITDFSAFLDDMIIVVEKAQRQDLASDPNRTVQSFIDLCQRHEDNFYKFIHEVHTHDNGLFTSLMGWLEDCLDFLRKGPAGGAIDMNGLFSQAVNAHHIDQAKAIGEIDSLIAWQTAKKKWHEDKTRQKMASAGESDKWAQTLPGNGNFSGTDFGIDPDDLADMTLEDDNYDEEEHLAFDDLDDGDPIAAERKRRASRADMLRRNAGQPVKPIITELSKMKDDFIVAMKKVLAE